MPRTGKRAQQKIDALERTEIRHVQDEQLIVRNSESATHLFAVRVGDRGVKKFGTTSIASCNRKVSSV